MIPLLYFLAGAALSWLATVWHFRARSLAEIDDGERAITREAENAGVIGAMLNEETYAVLRSREKQ